MFLDTSGAGGPWQDDTPEPQRAIRTTSKDLAWLLTHAALMIFFATLSFAAHWTGQLAARDSYLLLMAIPSTGALCVLFWIVFEWYMREIPHPYMK